MRELPRVEPTLQTSEQTSLTLVGERTGAVAPVRDAAEAQRLAEQYVHLVERLVDRLGVWLPDEVARQGLLERGRAALYEAAATTPDPEAVAGEAVQAVEDALRRWLGASEWYREAMVGRAEPLLRACRGLTLSGHEVTDKALCRKLEVAHDQLAGFFVEFATVFTLEPKALLPAGADVKYSMAANIAGLPSEQQLAMALYFHQQLTFPEIAKVMDQEPARVQELFGRAAAHLCAEASLASWPGRKLVA